MSSRSVEVLVEYLKDDKEVLVEYLNEDKEMFDKVRDFIERKEKVRIENLEKEGLADLIPFLPQDLLNECGCYLGYFICQRHGYVSSTKECFACLTYKFISLAFIIQHQ